MVYAAPTIASLSSMAYSTLGSLSSSFASASSSYSYNHLRSHDASPPHRLKQPAHSGKGDDIAALSIRTAEPQNAPLNNDNDGATATAGQSTLLHPDSIGTNTVLTVPVPPQLRVPHLVSRVATDRDADTFAMSHHLSLGDNEARTSANSVPPSLTNLPRRRSHAVDRSSSPSSSGSVNRRAGLRLDLSDIANPNTTAVGTGPGKDEDNSKQDNTTLPAARQTAPAVMSDPAASAFRPATMPTNASSRVYVRPTPEQLQERHHQREVAQRQSAPSISPSPSFIRKKSGELVKPSLKSVSMFSKHLGGNGGGARPGVGLTLRLDGLPVASGTRSEPTTPTGSKMVHFDAKLEHVKHFLTEQKPLAVSRDGSPTETSEGGEDFGLHKGSRNGDGVSTNSDGGRSSEDEKVRKMLAMHVMNMPGYESAIDALRARWEGEHVRLEGLSLVDDGRGVRGTVLVRNLAYGKHVAARFTMDRWQTTSEVTARYVESVLGGAYDRFEFAIRLADYLGRKIWGRALEVAIRYSCDGHGDMWDNNQGKNYIAQFGRKTLPIIHSKSEGNSEDEEEGANIFTKRNEQVGLKVAQLKKSLEKVARVSAPAASAHPPPAPPGLPSRVLSVTTNVGSATAQPSFVNSRSAADALHTVGRQGFPSPASSAMNRTFHLGADRALPPLSPKRNREGTLAGRYDISSSLRNASLHSPTNRVNQLQGPSSVPFPNSPPPLSRTTPASQVQSSSPQYSASGFASVPGQKFVSRDVAFNMRSAGRGSPRDALTPSSTALGGLVDIGSSLSPPHRTSSDSDLPASFQSASETPSSPSPNFGDNMHVAHHSFLPQPPGIGASNLSVHDRGEATRDVQPSYFLSRSWNSAIAPLDPANIPKSLTPSGDANQYDDRSTNILIPSPHSAVPESLGIEYRLNGSPPVPRFHSFPPLLHAVQYDAPSFLASIPAASEISTSIVADTEPAKTENTERHENPPHSVESSSTPSPSLTTDSTSPISSPGSLFTPTHPTDTAGGSTPTRSNDINPKNLDILDEYVRFSNCGSPRCD